MDGKNINPRMLILARHYRNHTQREAAELLCMNQGKLSKHENGILRVSNEDLNNYSSVYRFPKDFFYQEGNIYPVDISFSKERRVG